MATRRNDLFDNAVDVSTNRVLNETGIENAHFHDLLFMCFGQLRNEVRAMRKVINPTTTFPVVSGGSHERIREKVKEQTRQKGPTLVLGSGVIVIIIETLRVLFL
tara:strand:- start:5497 stop:5811 length:315 start_codon:yes stop_codon:yes gene_type:complete